MTPDPRAATDGPALLTDRYELTMLAAALADGTADRACVFDVFARRLPSGRRYGVVAGTGRLLDLLADFRFSAEQLEVLAGELDSRTLEWLADYRFTGDIDGYPEGELYFADSPVLQVRGSFGECVVLETLILSVLNHDCAIAAAAARMVSVADSRPLIEMGSRRTHEQAAVAAARAAYLVGFASTSNLEATRRHGVPSSGTSAHAFTLLHTTEAGPDEAAAFRAQVAALGTDTTLLVDTYDISRGVATAVEVAGTDLGGVRIDSGDLGMLARQVRDQLDGLGARQTRIVVSGDLDEYAIAALRAEPVDVYGVGTRLVTGSGAPTAGMVYKLVEVEGIPVAKRSAHKETIPGAKRAHRVHRASGTAVEELLVPFDSGVPAVDSGCTVRELSRPLVRGGERVADPVDLAEIRELHARAMTTLPWEGLALSSGDPALRTRVAAAR